MTEGEREKRAAIEGYAYAYNRLEAWAKANPDFTFGDLQKRSIEELQEGKSEATPYSYSDEPELDSAYRKGIRTAVQETFWTWQVEAKQREEKAFLEQKQEHAMGVGMGIG